MTSMVAWAAAVPRGVALKLCAWMGMGSGSVDSRRSLPRTHALIGTPLPIALPRRTTSGLIPQ